MLRKIKWFFQKLIRGYSDLEIWSPCYFLSKIISTYLKRFRNQELHGHPSELKNIEEWQKILDEMIWTFENWDRDEEYFHHHGPMVFGEPDKKGNIPLLDTGCTMDKKGINKHNKRVEAGFLLFAKYFRHLWD